MAEERAAGMVAEGREVVKAAAVRAGAVMEEVAENAVENTDTAMREEVALEGAAREASMEAWEEE